MQDYKFKAAIGGGSCHGQRGAAKAITFDLFLREERIGDVTANSRHPLAFFRPEKEHRTSFVCALFAGKRDISFEGPAFSGALPSGAWGYTDIGGAGR